jgi:phosphoribosylformylglycinamidine synthase
LALKAPLISGKDSMKNDYKGTHKNGQPVKISVLPTLLVTALGRMPDYKLARSADFKKAGDKVYKLGPSQLGLAQSEWQGLQAVVADLEVATPNWPKALNLYQWLGSKESCEYLRSAHDLSEGGLLTALAESCFTNNLGLEFKPEMALHQAKISFGEGFHQFIVSVPEEKTAAAEALWQKKDIEFVEVGILRSTPEWKWTHQGQSQNMAVEELYQAWSGESL